MIIKNFAKNSQIIRASIYPHSQTITTGIVDQNKYLFSRNFDKKSTENKQQNTSSFKIFQDKKIIIKKSPFYTAAYLKRLGLRRHYYGPLLNRLQNLNKILMKIYNISQAYEGRFKFLIFNIGKIKLQYILIFLLSIVFLIAIFAVKIKEKLPRLIDTVNAVKINGNDEKLNMKFEQMILNLTKIQIIQMFVKVPNVSSDKQEQQHEDPSKAKGVYYKIIMEDKNGKQHIANPYQGDPNNFLKYLQYIQQKHNRSERINVVIKNEQQYNLREAFSNVFGFLSIFIPVAITFYLFRKMDPTSILKNFGKGVKQFKIQAMKDIKTRFKDVAGMDQAKKQITQFVDFLKHNEKYNQIGAKIPKGALLTGPPGTGKTMLARACAGQAGVSFFYISGSEFVQVFVGLGASKVRDLFAKARQNAPSIIFIDQIDAIGKKRQTSRNEEKDSTLNQLLVQMDGFSSNQTIIVLAATNRKQILDNALTRPGRFDRLVQINLPDVKARQQIFMVHLAPLKIDPITELKTVAKRLSELTPGFSGADISNLCNQAAIIATRKNRAYIIDKDFQEATQRITAGYIKKNLMKQKTKKRVAYHEAGHAVSSWFLKGGDPLVKLTIIPRSKGALGYAQYLPKSTYIAARSQLIDKVAIMLGGITSQQIFFGNITSGGSDDLQKVYSLTRRMVTQFGMGNSTYNITIDEQSYIQKQSIFLTDKMQQQVAKILQEARKRSREIIEQKRHIIQALAKQLIQKQTLNSVEIRQIMGQRPIFEEVKKADLLA